MRHAYETGVQAVPVVAVIAFLISIILAYIGAQQLRPFGAEIFTVDLVAIGVLRELGVLLTAIMVAGRTGSAYAAELGVMKLNDEVDALESLGLDPFEVLVLPRVLGLVIAMPLLTIIADAMGLAGGAVLTNAAARAAVGAVPGAARFSRWQHHVLGRPGKGAGVRGAYCAHRHDARAAGTRIVPGARPAHHHGGRAVDLSRHLRGRGIRGLLSRDRLLSAEEPIIAVRDVVNRFGAQVVHDGVSFDVCKGEIFGIVGGSGSWQVGAAADHSWAASS